MLAHVNRTSRKPGRVVVIGAKGFVGGMVARRLQQDGVSVLELDRSEVDLLAPGAADVLAGFLRPEDAVVAVAAIAPCKTTDMLKDNVTLSQALVSSLAKAGVAHVVNVSSDAVYADGPVPLTEETPTAPNTLHGAMHLVREILFRSEIAPPLAIVRPSLLYGARDPHNGYGPNQFRRKANAGSAIALFGEGEERRDHVLINDLAELVSRILHHRSTGVLNIATGAVHSFREVAELAVSLAPKPVEITSIPRRGPMPHNGYRPFDIAACKAAFPGFHFTPLPEGMRRAQQEEFAHGGD